MSTKRMQKSYDHEFKLTLSTNHTYWLLSYRILLILLSTKDISHYNPPFLRLNVRSTYHHYIFRRH